MSTRTAPLLMETAPAPRPEVAVSVAGEPDSHVSYAGLGLTVDDVIAEWRDDYRGYWDAYDGASAPEEYAARWADLVVWEGTRAAALLRPHPGGRRELVVTRLDA